MAIQPAGGHTLRLSLGPRLTMLVRPLFQPCSASCPLRITVETLEPKSNAGLQRRPYGRKRNGPNLSHVNYYDGRRSLDRLRELIGSQPRSIAGVALTTRWPDVSFRRETVSGTPNRDYSQELCAQDGRWHSEQYHMSPSTRVTKLLSCRSATACEHPCFSRRREHQTF